MIEAMVENSRDDGKEAVKHSLSDAEAVILSAEQAIATFKEEAALVTSIKALEKAVTEATDQRKAEVNEKLNFAMLKQSLEDQLKFNNKDKADETAAKPAASEANLAIKRWMK